MKCIEKNRSSLSRISHVVQDEERKDTKEMEKQMAIFIDSLYGVLMTFEFNSQGDLSNVNENFSYNNRRKNGEKEFRLKFRNERPSTRTRGNEWMLQVYCTVIPYTRRRYRYPRCGT